MSDYKPIPQHILDEDLAKMILYSAANVRGVFVCNREDYKQMCRALDVGGVKPIVDKVGHFLLLPSTLSRDPFPPLLPQRRGLAGHGG